MKCLSCFRVGAPGPVRMRSVMPESGSGREGPRSSPFRFAAAVLGVVSGLGLGAAAVPVQAASAVEVDVAPVRAWRAFVHQAEAEGGAVLHLDHDRYEARVAVPGGGVIALSIDWDERSGGSVIAWEGAKPAAEAAFAPLAARIAARALAEPRDNHLCRGPEAEAGAVPDSEVEEAPTCRYGAGRFSSALFELEKCGDYESALRILAACVTEQHAGGLVRLAQFYESGLGVPRRLERMTEYLRRAALSSTPGYRDTARVQYATALYFGVGTEPDRERALKLFREAADSGEPDAIHFLRFGYHTAWRRMDGSVYVDRDWLAPEADGS